MSTHSRLVRRLAYLVVVLAVLATACSSDDTDETVDDPGDDSSTSTTVADSSTTTTTTTTTTPAAAGPPADVEGPVTGGNGPNLPQPAVPVPEGFVEEEFFVGGTATSYRQVGEATSDGFWTAEPVDTAEYRTRILVRRPPADRFSGTVIVEWFNVSAGEASPDWAFLAPEIDRAGHAYVGVSVQSLGVVGGQSLLEVEVDEETAAELGPEDDEFNTGGLVNLDPDRYGSLSHPGDAYAYDIYGQVGALLVAGEPDVLGGLEPMNVIALGESQSAGYLTTYINAIHPLASVYDAFLVHSRGGGGTPVEGRFVSDEESGERFVSDGVRTRTDLAEPVFILQAETDLTLLGYHLARQPDTDTVRTWELAGTAHADAYILSALGDGSRNPEIGSLLGCTEPINAGPHREGLTAALAHLIAWVEDGVAPPTGTPLELTETDDGEVAIARDDLGRALGGVRNPLVDVPVEIYSGDPPGGTVDDLESFGICDLFGQTRVLEQEELIALHGSADDYVAAFAATTEEVVDGGFLLPADADLLLAEAEENRARFG